MIDTLTVFGRVADAEGLSLQHFLDDTLRDRTRAWAAPPSEFRAVQPRGLVKLGHDGWPVARIAAIERDRAGIWITATSNDLNLRELIENRDGWYLSSETDAHNDRTGIHKDILLKGAALVRASASVGIGQALVLDGDLTRPHDRQRWHRLPEHVRVRLDRAAAYIRANRDADVLTMLEPPAKIETMPGGSAWLVNGELVADNTRHRVRSPHQDGRPTGALRRSGLRGRVIDVR